MLIDFHSHILPGIDDGAKNWGEFLEIARQAIQVGITHMVCTPHFIYREAEFERENYYNLLNEATLKLRMLDLNLNLIPGSEVFYVPELLYCYEKELLVTINSGNKYIMLEFPRFNIPNNVEETICSLTKQGLTPIIAHPERNLAFANDPELLIKLLKMGALAQLNIGSLVSGYGAQVRKTAETFIKAGMIQLLGSDVHSPKNAFRNFNPGLKIIEELLGGRKLKELITVNPYRIIRGDTIDWPNKKGENIISGSP